MPHPGLADEDVEEVLEHIDEQELWAGELVTQIGDVVVETRLDEVPPHQLMALHLLQIENAVDTAEAAKKATRP